MTEPVDLKAWLEESPLAIPGKVVLERTTLSAREIQGIRAQGHFTPPGPDGEAFLEVGGKTLARGKVVHTGKGSFFKVTRLVEENNGGKP